MGLGSSGRPPPGGAHLLLMLAALAVACNAQSSCNLVGTADLALVGAGDRGGAYATCFARFRLRVDSSCGLWVVPATNATKWRYSAVWSPVELQDTRQRACPTAALSGGTLTDQTAAELAAAVKSTLSTALYGAAASAVSAVAFSGSSFNVSVAQPGATELQFAVVKGALGELLSANDPAACSASDSPCRYHSGGCEAGRHSFVAGSGSSTRTLCLLCAPGMNCTGGTAAAACCPMGSAAVAGSASCTPCAPGYFSDVKGLSHCAPAPSGTYQDQSGATSVKYCPWPSDALFPGSAACLACFFGAPMVFAGAGGVYPDNVPAEQPSSGYLVATTSAASPLANTSACGFSPFTAACANMSSRPLAVFVDGTCQVVINMLGDEGCSQTSNVTTFDGAFADATTILASVPVGPATALNMRIKVSSRPGNTSLESISFFEVTTLFDRPASSLGSCSDALTPLPNGTCPAGTSPDDNPQASDLVPVLVETECSPCQGGGLCDGQDARQCPAGTFSDVYGATSCQRCPEGTISNVGSTSCDACDPGTVPSINQTTCLPCPLDYDGMPVCCLGGQYLEVDTSQCLACPAGTHSHQGSVESQCTPCQPGTASGPHGAATNRTTGSCPACPPGQYASATGSQACAACPAGTISAAGAAACSPCEPGLMVASGGTQCVPIPYPPPPVSPPASPPPPSPPKRLRARSITCASIGFITLALTSTNDTASAFATCFAQLSLRVDTSCNLWLVPAPGATKWRYSGLWTPVAVQDTRLRGCPTAAISAGLLTTESAADVADAIKDVLSKALYGEAATAIASVDVGGNGMNVTVAEPSRAALQFAVVEGALGRVLNASDTTVCSVAASACRYQGGCAAGRHSVTVAGNASALLCALCPPGLSCSGGDSAPTSCGAGTSALVGSAACVSCAPGSFSDAPALSHCKLAPPGTYQVEAGATSVKYCPDASETNIPGSTACLSCFLGRPVVYAGTGGVYPDNVPSEQPSSGYLVATTSAPSPLSNRGRCAFNPFTSACTSLDSRVVSIFVDWTCQVVVSVLGDEGCSQETDVTTLTGAFADPTTILAAAPSYPANAVSLRIKLTPAGRLQSVDFFQVTTVFDRSASSLGTCSDSLMPPSGVTCPVGTAPEANPQIGNVTAVFRASQCTPCEAGSQCDGSQSQLCDAGSFSDVNGASSCQACPAATISSPGSAGCDICMPGTVPSADADSCLPCPYSQAGAANRSADTCYSSCPAGSYLFPTTYECLLCPPGTHSAAGAIFCTPCKPGTATNDYGTPTDNTTASCPACPAGQYTNVANSHTCNDCEPGSFSAANGSATCTPCGPGWVTLNGDATKCVPCAKGWYRPGLENRCYSCPSGYQTGVNGTGAFNCTACPPGMYAPLPNTPLCMKCGPASFAASPGSRICKMCPAGFITGSAGGNTGDALGASSCNACPRRTFRPSMYAANVCTLCPTGRETRKETGASFCNACIPGTTLLNPSDINCTICPAGTYTNSQGRSGNCSLCDVGYAVADLGNSVCDICAPGTYSDTPGSVNCTECPPGSYTEMLGSTIDEACQPVPAGNYAAGSGNDGFTPCDAGTYQPEWGQDKCLDCPPGQECSLGSVNPKPCRPGFYADLKQPFCKECPKGQFQDQWGQRACKPCPTGSYCPATKLTKPTACPPGMFGTRIGSVTMNDCRKCPINTFSARAGSQSCANCPAGQWTARLQGQKACWPTSKRLPNAAAAAATAAAGSAALGT